MSNLFVLILFSVLLLIFFGIYHLLQKVYSKSSQKISRVFAGDANEHSSLCYNAKSLSPFESFSLNGKRIDSSDYIVASVEGECMGPRGIHSGDIVFIHKLLDAEKNDIKDSSVLYIRKDDCVNETFLLREYIKDKSCNDVVATRFYRNGIEPKESEPHHKLQNVVGVVRYCFK